MFNETIDSRYDGSFQTVWLTNKAGTSGGNNFAIGDTAAYTAKTTIPASVMNSKKYTTYDVSKHMAAMECLHKENSIHL
jgi:hypothetical protein